MYAAKNMIASPFSTNVQKTKILHLEDLSSDAELIRRVIMKSELPVEMLWVNNKPDFIAALNAFDPDLVLSDHSLPGITSEESLKLVKERNPATPFILITATVSEEFAVKMMKNGVEDYILKDRLQRLPQAIVNTLDKMRAEEEKKKYARETEVKEKRFRELIENISDAVLLLDEQLAITYFSPSATQMLQHKNLTGMNFLELIAPDDLGLMTNMFETIVLRGGSAASLKFRIKNSKPGVLWAEGTFSNKLKDESIAGITVNFRDITQWMLDDVKIRKSKADLKTIFDNTSVSYLLLDPNFNVVSYNEEAKRKYRQEMGIELIEHTNIVECLSEEMRNANTDRFKNVLKGEKVSYETVYHHPNQQNSWYWVEVSPIMTDNNVVLGILCASEDISNRKNTEVEKERMTLDILQRNKDLEQFTYIISHNLRAPVANILGLANLMKERDKLKSGDFEKCLEGLDQAVNKLDHVIRDLSDIVQIRKGVDQQMEVVELEPLFEDIISSIGNQTKDEDISFESDFEVSTLFTIKSYITSILLNLVTNSLKYRRPDVHTTIRISSGIENESVRLHFSDNGLGIDLEKYGDKLFGLYKRFHNHVEGKGMGLYMVKTQVEALGGTLSVTSKVDEGTSFTILLKNNLT